jgi:DNA-binding beta-propeller fold protein YncE
MRILAARALRVILSSGLLCAACVGVMFALSAISLAGQTSVCIATAGTMTPSAWSAPSSVSTLESPKGATTLVAPLRVLADVPLPGPAKRFDYQSFDPSSNRLYISHMRGDRLDVFDTRAGRLVTSLEGFPGATGVWAVPALHKVYVSVTEKHQVAVVDGRTLETLAMVPGADFPDGIAYAPDQAQLFVSDERGGVDLVIDGITNARIALIPLGGEAGNTHYDSVSHCMLVTVQTKNELVAIDPGTRRIVARYSMSCDHPHGFLIDELDRLAFVTCEGDAKLLVLDLRAMRTTASIKIPDDPDVLAFDPGLHRLYVACESGSLAVFAERDAKLTSLGDYRAPHAHTVAVDPTTHRVYLPLQDIDGKPVLRILEPSRS